MLSGSECQFEILHSFGHQCVHCLHCVENMTGFIIICLQMSWSGGQTTPAAAPTVWMCGFLLCSVLIG